VDTCDFYVKLFVKTKSDGFEWILVGVYGAAQDALIPDFQIEIFRICESENLPMLVGGDFNIIRRPKEKNNDNFNASWPFIFNEIIETLDLRDVIMSGRQFTWASRREIPIYEKLDRVLTNVEWEQKFPLVIVRALTRTSLYHSPLLIDSREATHIGNKNTFSFDLSWMCQDGFFEMVKDEWIFVNSGVSPVERWQHKVRHLRLFLRGWAKNLSGVYKKEKERLTLLIYELDLKGETTPLSETERVYKKEDDIAIAKLQRDEDTKWAQRAKLNHIQEGGNNTKYFHLIANGKRRKKGFSSLSTMRGP
jgi:hypothetical protein